MMHEVRTYRRRSLLLLLFDSEQARVRLDSLSLAAGGNRLSARMDSMTAAW